MKKLLFMAVALTTTAFAHAQSTICEGFMLMDKGVTLVYKDYDAKEKYLGSQSHTIKDIVSSGSAVTVTMHQVSKDNKDKITSEGDYSFVCENGEIKIDMKSMMDQKTMDGLKEMELAIEQNNLIFPSTFAEGQTLPDGQMTMTVSSGGYQVMKMTMYVIERKVEKAESITTPAGTFDCYKCSATMKMDMPLAKSTTKSISWISKGLGQIRTESYNEKGELQNVHVLAEIIR
jgi:hypothetical protein